MSNYLFIVGTGRCGSTLVHEVLARHPGIGFVSNLEDNLPGLTLPGHLNGEVYRRLPPGLSRKGRLRFAPSEAYRLLDHEVSPILSRPGRDLVGGDVTPWLADRFRNFFSKRAARQGTPVFSHKFTGWPRSGFVHEILPEARFVNVVRDGRAVANSWLQMPWWLGYAGPEHWQWGALPPAAQAEWEAAQHSFVVLAGLAWKVLMDAYERARTLVPADQWLDVRYEDLMADPRRGFAQLLAHVGLDWTPAFEDGFGRYSFSTGRSEAFRRDLGPLATRALEECIAEPLVRSGYRLASAPPGSHRAVGRP